MSRTKWTICFALLGCLLIAGSLMWYFFHYREYIDLIYTTVDGAPLTLDLNLPRSPRGPSPVVVYFPPDGEWARSFKQYVLFNSVIATCTSHDYAIATVHYRSHSKSRFPAPIEDAKAAIRWLRANAGRFNLDPDHIGVVGVSVGGWLASILGTTDPADGFEGSEQQPISSRVQAVISMGAPLDCTRMDHFAVDLIPKNVHKLPGKLESILNVEPFLGASYKDKPELYKRASPGTHATPDDPPFLLFHSTRDKIVPVQQSRLFAQSLRQAKVEVELVEIDDDEHVWSGANFKHAIERSLQFLDKHLKR